MGEQDDIMTGKERKREGKLRDRSKESERCGKEGDEGREKTQQKLN